MTEECSACRNLLDLQRIAAIAQLDQQISRDHKDGYGLDVDEALDRRLALVAAIRNGSV